MQRILGVAGRSGAAMGGLTGGRLSWGTCPNRRHRPEPPPSGRRKRSPSSNRPSRGYDKAPTRPVPLPPTQHTPAAPHLLHPAAHHFSTPPPLQQHRSRPNSLVHSHPPRLNFPPSLPASVRSFFSVFIPHLSTLLFICSPSVNLALFSTF